MGKYIHIYDTVDENNEDYQIGGENYREPWTSSVKRDSRGVRYFVKYNKIIDIVPDNFQFSTNGGSENFVIDSVTPWQITNETDWVTISPLTGSTGETMVTITVTSTTQDRSESFVVAGNNGKNKTITVEQTYDGLANPPSVIWVDDFPEDIDYEYPTIYDYFDAYIEDPDSFGSNKCEYTDEIIEFNGEEFYLYSFIDSDSEDEIYYALLPVTSSFNSLYPHSIENDPDNRYQPFAYILSLDDSIYWDAENNDGDGKDFVLVKVEE